MRGALAAVAVFGCVAVACGGSSNPRATPENTTGGATETVVPPAPPAPLTGVEILRKSDAAMAAKAVIVETKRWDRRAAGPEQDEAAVVHYEGRIATPLSNTSGLECEPQEIRNDRFATRSLGALAFHAGQIGETAPEEVELLGEELLGPNYTWVVRYRFKMPSIEGAYWVERREWIDQDSFWLLREEYEEADPLGFNGQAVSVIREAGGEPECGLQPEIHPSLLRPTTSLRLQNVYE